VKRIADNSANNEKVQKIIYEIISRAINVNIDSNIPFSEEHIEVLNSLNEYSVNHILSDPEIIRDPRKIPYKANEELKICLVAICLSQSLTNPLRKHRETKEFFIENINIGINADNQKFLSFGNLEPENVLEAINWEIAEDWKIFRDREGHGIISLINEKTNLTGLDNYKVGGDLLYEFARFQRKFTEKERKKEEKARESAQEAFRNAIVQSLATEVAKQQLLEGKNPFELVDLLFAPSRNRKEIKSLKNSGKKIESQIQNSITLLLEGKTPKSEED
jgi:hypothetical protein